MTKKVSIYECNSNQKLFSYDHCTIWNKMGFVFFACHFNHLFSRFSQTKSPVLNWQPYWCLIMPLFVPLLHPQLLFLTLSMTLLDPMHTTTLLAYCHSMSWVVETSPITLSSVRLNGVRVKNPYMCGLEFCWSNCGWLYYISVECKEGSHHRSWDTYFLFKCLLVNKNCTSLDLWGHF